MLSLFNTILTILLAEQTIGWKFRPGKNFKCTKKLQTQKNHMKENLKREISVLKKHPQFIHCIEYHEKHLSWQVVSHCK